MPYVPCEITNNRASFPWDIGKFHLGNLLCGAGLALKQLMSTLAGADSESWQEWGLLEASHRWPHHKGIEPAVKRWQSTNDKKSDHEQEEE